uniref:Uncharacterized protein n=1 Tax=Candidatus Kentrum sp. TUN TaxID=2126343 RepID=A0A451A8H6_9GAMM|nr:MAG: hypothetical protein BECKTUN1418D_GA0071000_11731 [Candidatus Kentron sp. TUN]
MSISAILVNHMEQFITRESSLIKVIRKYSGNISRIFLSILMLIGFMISGVQLVDLHEKKFETSLIENKEKIVKFLSMPTSKDDENKNIRLNTLLLNNNNKRYAYQGENNILEILSRELDKDKESRLTINIPNIRLESISAISTLILLISGILIYTILGTLLMSALLFTLKSLFYRKSFLLFTKAAEKSKENYDSRKRKNILIQFIALPLSIMGGILANWIYQAIVL